MDIVIPESLRRLNETAGFPVYVVGGHIRNAIAGFGESDIDIAGPAAAQALGISKRYHTQIVNYRLGTAVISVGDDKYEYTPFRLEKYSGGEHTPVEVLFTTDLRQDALRRDFTCNSIYYEIGTGKIFDPTGGIKDIENKIIRAVNPDYTFTSDGLRTLRLVRIAVETGFKIDAKTAVSAKNNAHLLRDISSERKRMELDKILVADTKYGVAGAHYRGLKLMHQLGLWQYVLPQIEDGDKMPQNPLYHKYDVMEHIFQTVKFSEPSIRLAALMHDIGKPYCVKNFGNMHGHEKVSATIAEYVLGQKGLKYSNDVVDEVKWLCLNHMVDMDGKMRENKLKLFVAQNFDRIDKLVMLIRADRLATGFENTREREIRIEQVKNWLVQNEAPLKVTDLKIDGGALILEGIQSIKIGGILEELWRNCVIEPRFNNEEWLLQKIRNFSNKLEDENISE